MMKDRKNKWPWCGLLGAWLCVPIAGCGSGPKTPGPEVSASFSPRAAHVEEAPAPAVPAPLPRAARPDDWFEDVTEQTGIRFAYRTGREGEQYTVLEPLGGGVAGFDYDRDGDVDLFFLGGGRISGPPPKVEGLPPKLYRNDGDWQFTDVTEAAGLNSAGDYSLGCAVGDFDRDGCPDLFVTCFGRSRLFHNDGKGRFTDVTDDAGLAIDGFSSAAVWADVDRDGWPDLYVVGYLRVALHESKPCGDLLRKIKDICGPKIYDGAPDRLFRNRGDNTFEEITKTAGLSEEGKGLGVVAADLNEDGWIDFYVANDTTANHLYLGGPGLRFRETGLAAGVAVDENGTPQGSMGIGLGDYDGDGHCDIWVTNFEREHNTLYRSRGGGEFTDSTLAAGLANVGRPEVGFGTGFVDFDSDGWLDLYVTNGHVQYYTGQSPYLQPAFLLQNLQGKTFANRSAVGGPYFSVPHAGRGAASADLDNDGAIDLVIVHQNDPVVLLRNRRAPPSWVRIELRGAQSDPAAIGAVVALDYQGRQLNRVVVGGEGYLSHADQRIVFPADDDQPRDVTVRWLSGKEEVFRGVPVRQTTQLVEGAGEDER
jgi:hypothetical protein